MMPAYNAEPFLAQALDSALQQDFDSFEVIVCDDGSKDQTWQVLQTYRSDRRVRLLRLTCNRGTGRARNEILKLARGHFIVLLDADDLLLPGALSGLAQALADNPMAGVVHGQIFWQESHFDEPLRQSALPAWDLLGNAISNVGTAIRSDIMRRLGGYDERLTCAEDWDFWLRAADITPIVEIPSFPVAIWRRRPEGRSRAVTQNQQRAVTRQLLERAVWRRYGLRICEQAWEERQEYGSENQIRPPMQAAQRFQPASAEILGKVIDDEAIVLDLATGNYYSLEASGALVWQRLEAGDSLAEIEQSLLRAYQVEPEQARADLHELLSQLLAQGLIKETV